MLVAPEFQQAIARALEAEECSTVSEPDKVTTVMVMPTAPGMSQVAAAASKQIGELYWTTPLEDGRREGRVTIRIARAPVHFDGRVSLVYEDGVTRVDYDAEQNLNIPTLSALAEREVAERSAAIIRQNQPLGEEWLRAHGVAHPEPPAV
jgi:hypothetical protein